MLVCEPLAYKWGILNNFSFHQPNKVIAGSFVGYQQTRPNSITVHEEIKKKNYQTNANTLPSQSEFRL